MQLHLYEANVERNGIMAVDTEKKLQISKDMIDVWLAVNMAQKNVYLKVSQALKDAGLPDLTWFDVLFQLEHSRDGLRPYEIEKVMLFRTSGLSRVLGRIIAKGYIEEFKFAGDGRGKILKITDAGRKVSRQIWAVYGAELGELMGPVVENCQPEILIAGLRPLIHDWQIERYEYLT